MNVLSNLTAARQAGAASGGGVLDSFKAAAGMPTTTAPTQTGDGSIGLFDGVWKKAAFGGAAGAAMSFLPIVPGGWLIGGVLGALGGAAMGVFGNWTKMNAIKQENQATIAALGVQTDDPQVQQILQSGQVGQLIPYIQQKQGGVATQQGVPSQAQYSSAEAAAMAEQNAFLAQAAAQQAQQRAAGQLPMVVDPSAKAAQTPMPQQGRVLVGSGALNPNVAVNPGVAPALRYANGGGSAGDAGRPPAPTAARAGTDARAIAPVQAGLGVTVATAPPTATAVTTSPTGQALAGAATATTITREQALAIIAQLQAQIDQLTTALAA